MDLNPEVNQVFEQPVANYLLGGAVEDIGGMDDPEPGLAFSFFGKEDLLEQNQHDFENGYVDQISDEEDMEEKELEENEDELKQDELEEDEVDEDHLEEDNLEKDELEENDSDDSMNEDDLDDHVQDQGDALIAAVASQEPVQQPQHQLQEEQNHSQDLPELEEDPEGLEDYPEKLQDDPEELEEEPLPAEPSRRKQLEKVLTKRVDKKKNKLKGVQKKNHSSSSKTKSFNETLCVFEVSKKKKKGLKQKDNVILPIAEESVPLQEDKSDSGSDMADSFDDDEDFEPLPEQHLPEENHAPPTPQSEQDIPPAAKHVVCQEDQPMSSKDKRLPENKKRRLDDNHEQGSSKSGTMQKKNDGAPQLKKTKNQKNKAAVAPVQRDDIRNIRDGLKTMANQQAAYDNDPNVVMNQEDPYDPNWDPFDFANARNQDNQQDLNNAQQQQDNNQAQPADANNQLVANNGQRGNQAQFVPPQQVYDANQQQYDPYNQPQQGVFMQLGSPNNQQQQANQYIPPQPQAPVQQAAVHPVLVPPAQVQQAQVQYAPIQQFQQAYNAPPNNLQHQLNQNPQQLQAQPHFQPQPQFPAQPQYQPQQQLPWQQNNPFNHFVYNRNNWNNGPREQTDDEVVDEIVRQRLVSLNSIVRQTWNQFNQNDERGLTPNQIRELRRVNIQLVPYTDFMFSPTQQRMMLQAFRPSARPF